MFKRFWWVFLVMFPAGALGGLLIAVVVTYVMPKMYESEAVIEVLPIGDVWPQSTKPEGETPDWLLTEIGKMRDREVLDGVSDRLELQNRWNLDKDQLRDVLDRTLLIQSIRGTDLVSIRVRHTNKEDARDIAEEVANTYKEYREAIENIAADHQLQELNKAVRDQEDKVEEKREVLAGTTNLTRPLYYYKEPEIETNEPDVRRELSSQEYIDAKRELETAQQLLQTMKLKQVGEIISGKIPSESVVVHDSAVIAYAPVSPNVALNLSLGTTLGFLLSPLMALPLMWLLNRLKPAKA